MGFDDGPAPLPLGPFQAFRSEAESGGHPLFAPDPLIQLVVGFHPSRLNINPLTVQQTGRLRSGFWSNATRTPFRLFRLPVAEPLPVECSYTIGGGEYLNFAQAEAW
jgi:hypothetical protein